jgi:hypothetical protein
MENQPDLPDRTLVLKVDRLDEKRPEGALIAAIAQHRNAIWSELLDQLNAIVGCLRQAKDPEPVSFRMADFASFALRVGSLWSRREEVEQAFRKLEEAQAELVFEDDPIHEVIELWLATADNHGRAVDAGTLNREWTPLAARNNILWPFHSTKSLGRSLSQLRPALSQRFQIEVERDPHTKQNRYRFRPKTPTVAAAVAA